MVNTFLPYPDFVKSAKALDYKRLGKQRVEAWQILRALRGEKITKAQIFLMSFDITKSKSQNQKILTFNTKID